MSREEFAISEDLGGYYRVPPDGRDLNYDSYFEKGEKRITFSEDYNSYNTERLEVKGMKKMLLKLGFMQKIIKGENGSEEYLLG